MIDVQLAFKAIGELLVAEIDQTVMPIYPAAVVPKDVPTPPNDKRVLAYGVLYAGAGYAAAYSLAAWPLLAEVPFQVTVAGGTQDRTLNGVKLVRNTLAGVELEGFGLISERDFDTGPLRVDDSVVPPRHFVPLQFVLEP